MAVTPAAADTVSNAFALCSVIDSTGMASAPCEVSGWNSSVTAVIDMNSGEARKLCSQIAGLMRQKGLSFDKGWTLQIKSPYSGENSIAFCPL
jgi:hypothetical protein